LPRPSSSLRVFTAACSQLRRPTQGVSACQIVGLWPMFGYDQPIVQSYYDLAGSRDW
jgi:hypothetical protein